MCNSDERQQRPVQRVTRDSSQQRLRKERFQSAPIITSKPFSSSLGQTFLLNEKMHLGLASGLYTNPQNRRLLVEIAAEGLIVEGKLLGKQWEATQMAEQLLHCKDDNMEEITRMCAHLYSLDSFLYRKLNEIMRVMHEKQYEHVWKSKERTLGPFIFLIDQLSHLTPTPGLQKLITVYRGCDLTTGALEKWKELFEGSQMPIIEGASFPSFTSTSRSRNKCGNLGSRSECYVYFKK